MVENCGSGVNTVMVATYVTGMTLPSFLILVITVLFLRDVYIPDWNKHHPRSPLLTLGIAILILSTLTGFLRVSSGPLIAYDHEFAGHIVLIVDNCLLGVILSLTLIFSTVRLEMIFTDSSFALTSKETWLLRSMAVTASIAVFGCAVMLSFVRPDVWIISVTVGFATVAVLSGVPHAVIVNYLLVRRLRDLMVIDTVFNSQSSPNSTDALELPGFTDMKHTESSDVFIMNSINRQINGSPRVDESSQRQLLSVSAKSTVLSVMINLSYIISASGALTSMFRRCLDWYGTIGDILFWIGMLLFCLQTLLSFAMAETYYRQCCDSCDSCIVEMVTSLTNEEIDRELRSVSPQTQI